VSVISWVSGFFKRSSVNPMHPGDPALASMFGFGSISASGASVTADSSMRVAAVYACVRVLAQAVAQSPLHLYRTMPNGGFARATDHPLYELLHLKPNDWQTSFEWRESSVAHCALRGDAYSRIFLNAAGQIEKLVPLHPDRVWPFLAANGRIAFRHLPVKGGTEYLLDSEVLRLPGLSFDPTGRSLSPIELHRNTIGNSMVSTEYQGRLWANSAVPKGGIKTPVPLGDEAIKALRKNWNDRHSGPDNAGQIAILHGGLEWVNIGMTNDDAQYVELMQLSISDIARIFGVQPHKIGDLSKATFSNIEQQSIEFVTDTLRPWVDRWEDRMTISLLSPAERRTMKVEFDLNGLLRGDSAARAALYRTLFAIGALKPNDACRLEGLDPLEGEAAEKTYVQINMAPLDQLLDVLMKAPVRPQTTGIPNDGT
jgi:HK97 family phage portal protein